MPVPHFFQRRKDTMMIANANEIKDSLNMEEALVCLGHQLNRQRRTTCPVHGGTDANFSAKNNYGTCFSHCAGKTWSVTDLVMEVKNLTYPEALEWIASQSKINVQYQGGDRKELIEAAKQERDRKEELYLANEAALERYENGAVIEFKERYHFDGRDWSGETIKAFRLVQSPNDNVLAKQTTISKALLQELGLIKHSETKDIWYDFLRDRILFPIFTHQGRVAGFTGRKLSTAHPDSAKYKNSQESLVFEKRNLLYGIWQNRRTIQQVGALLFEGMADVVTAYDYDVRRAVATGGTAVTAGQLKLLKRYTNTVTVMMDGDDAGYKAARNAVEEAIAIGLRVQVCFFNEPTAEDQEAGMKRYDPDNFLRRYGKAAFEAVVEEQSQDGLMWRAMEEWNDKDIFRQHAAVSLAGRMISMLDEEMLRDHYQRELLTTNYFGKVHKNALEDAVKAELEKRMRDNNKPDLSAQQQSDIKKYGLYIKNHQYWVSGDEDMEGYPISNFSVEPVMLVVGSAKSERRVEIKNIYGAKFTANIDSDSFVEMTAFRKEVERRGNYLFLETFRPEHFTKVKRKLYDEMKVCYPITTLGRHAKKDFYAFVNGIVGPGGQFIEASENGIVNFDDAKFFLPAFANDDDTMLSDDEDNSYESEQNFIYIDTIKAPSFTEWSAMMATIHGENGMMGVAWYLSALFRDIIYDRNDCFPHLNCFGPPGCGKSFLAWSLSYMFGHARRPYNLNDGTNVGFFRRMAQVRNGVAWFDEYSNDIDFKRAQGLKNAYDGAGREKGVATTDNRTVTTKVNSGLVITGQELMVQDIAMYTRCITCSFPDVKRTQEQLDAGDALMALQKTGCLSQITAKMQSYREIIKTDFDEVYYDVRGQLKGMVQGKEVLDRLVNNYAVALSTAFIIDRCEPLGFKFADLLEFSLQNLLWQSNSIGQEDDLAVWWDTLQYYIAKNDLLHNDDILVQEMRTLKVRDSKGKETDTIEISFEEDRKVLFLTMTKSFRFYKEQIRKEGGKSGLNKEAIRYYLAGSPAFIGDVRAKKFAGTAKRCMAFDMTRMNFDLPISTHVEYEH